MADEGDSSFDLIHLNGPLTVEAILKTLQQRFVDGQCYVSTQGSFAVSHVLFSKTGEGLVNACVPVFACTGAVNMTGCI